MAPVSKNKKKIVFVRYHGRCAYCGKVLYFGHTDCTIDHILPISKGGKSGIENLALACRGCNCLKGNKSLATFRKSIGHPLYYELHPTTVSEKNFLEFNDELSKVLNSSSLRDAICHQFDKKAVLYNLLKTKRILRSCQMMLDEIIGDL